MRSNVEAEGNPPPLRQTLDGPLSASLLCLLRWREAVLTGWRSWRKFGRLRIRSLTHKQPLAHLALLGPSLSFSVFLFPRSLAWLGWGWLRWLGQLCWLRWLVLEPLPFLFLRSRWLSARFSFFFAVSLIDVHPLFWLAASSSHSQPARFPWHIGSGTKRKNGKTEKKVLCHCDAPPGGFG